MNLTSRLKGIEANLDDLQAGVEACSRAANRIDTDATKSNGLLNTPLRQSLVDHIQTLLACIRDQRGIVRELRRSVNDLRNEEKVRRAVRPPPPVRAAASRTR